MIEVLTIISSSWQITWMFGSVCGSLIVVYVSRKVSLATRDKVNQQIVRDRANHQQQIELKRLDVELQRIKRNEDLKQIEGTAH